MSDTTIITGLVSLLKTIEWFDDSSVFVDDFSVLDASSRRAPLVIIETPDTFIATQQTMTPQIIWEIPVVLFVRFTDWAESYALFREVRWALIDLMNGTAGERAALQTNPVDIRDIKNDAPISGYYDPYISAEDRYQALPLYLFQPILFITTEIPE